MLRRSLLIAGLFVVVGALAVPASAQGPGGGGFFGRGGSRSGAMLLTIPEVQTELGLTESQKSELKAIADGVQAKMRATFTQGGARPDFQNMSDADRQKLFQDMQKRMEEATKGVDEKIAGILNSKQNARLKELTLQREGAGPCSRRK